MSDFETLLIPKEYIYLFIHYLRNGMAQNDPITTLEARQTSQWYAWCELMKQKHLVKKEERSE